MYPVMTISAYVTLCKDDNYWYIVDSYKDEVSIPYNSKLEAFEAYRLGKIQWVFVYPK